MKKQSDKFVGFGVGTDGEMVCIETDSKLQPDMALGLAAELIKVARQTILQNEYKLRGELMKADHRF